MIYFLFILTVGLFIFFMIGMCYQESRKRKISFISALLFCVITTPLIGYAIITARPLRVPNKPCPHCGNTEKETEFCGICMKNEAGQHINDKFSD